MSDHNLYDKSSEQFVPGALHILTMEGAKVGTAEFVQTSAQEKENPEGCYVDCARALFKLPTSQWNAIILSDQVIQFGRDTNQAQPLTIRRPSQLALCFLNGINRLDDAYTLANYPRYLSFCRQNHLSVSGWSSEVYRAAFKVFDEALEQMPPAREPGRWFIHQANKNRYYEGSMEQQIEALQNKEVSLMSLNDTLVYCEEGTDQVSEYYSISDIQTLYSLAREAGLEPVATVKDWIEQGVAPTLLGFHYNDLTNRLAMAGLEGSTFTSGYRMQLVEKQAAKERAWNSSQWIWPDLRKQDFQPTWENLKQPHGWTVSLLMHELVLLDLQRFVEGQEPLKPMELMEVLIKQAQAIKVPLEQLYAALPERLRQQTLPRSAWAQHRLELAELALCEPAELTKDVIVSKDLRLSSEEWHAFVVRHPGQAAYLPEEVIGDWKFWHPMTDLAQLGEVIKPLIPEDYFKDPEFQRCALMTGLVQPAELGKNLLGINADDLNKVLHYAELTLEERMQAPYRSVALGVVLHDPRDVVLLPEAVLNSQVLYAAAYHDINLLNQVPVSAVNAHRLTDEQLRLILRVQTKSADEVARFAKALPAVYHTEAIYRCLQERMALYGVKEGLDRRVFLERSTPNQELDRTRNRTIGHRR